MATSIWMGVVDVHDNSMYLITGATPVSRRGRGYKHLDESVLQLPLSKG